MIVERMTWKAKPGQENALVEAVKEAFAMHPAPHGRRILTPNVGPYNEVVVEIEYDDISENAAYWEEWFSKPEYPAFAEKWNKMVVSGGGSEIWNLVE